MACDLTCYDNDGGDCNTCEENNLITCPDDSCAETIENCPNADCGDSGGQNLWIADGICDLINNNEICNYDGGDCCPCTCISGIYDCNVFGGTCASCIVDGDSSITCPEDCIDLCGDGICNNNETSITCPEDCIDLCGDGICNNNETFITCQEDCQGNCNAAPSECEDGEVSDCADGDCCLENWIGDGYCDGVDQLFGCDLTCYNNDFGDCGEYEQCCASVTTFDPCAAAWDAGYSCEEAENADLDCSSALECGYCDCEPGMTICSDGSCAQNVCNCPEADCACYGQIICWDSSCADTEVDCPEPDCDNGFVPDCSGDGDCCHETWIGDGFEDCEDQAYGCDLTCYDNDGGDCDRGTEGCNDCYNDYTIYGSECCDTLWEEYGIDCATLEGVHGWDCSGCNCPGDERVQYKKGEKNASHYQKLLKPQILNYKLSRISSYKRLHIQDKNFSDSTNIAIFYSREQDCIGIGPDVDCAGVCFGDAVIDECGVCNGDGIPCTNNGDVTGDGEVDVLDVVALVNAILDGTEINNGDVNLDNEVNVLDVVALVDIILNP